MFKKIQEEAEVVDPSRLFDKTYSIKRDTKTKSINNHVVGSENSSNSNRLFEIGIKNNVSSYLIDNPDLIQNNWFIDKKNILLTSGASAPEELTQNILNKIKKLTSAIVSELPAEKENVFFKLPLI